MSQWGKSDAATNTSIQWVSQVHLTQNTVNRAALFGNVTPGAIISGATKGIFGVDSLEYVVASGGVQSYIITNAGSGYSANAAVTLTATNGGSGATSNATANVTTNAGRITSVNANQVGSAFKTPPTVVVAAPTAVNISANTSAGFSNTSDTLIVSSANSRFQAGDRIYYAVPTGNTPIAPLSGNNYYYVAFANTTRITIAATPGGANIDITDARITASAETHTIQGETATASAVVSGGENVGASAGWNLRTVGTGGRAGRVQYECLVAMRTIATDASDDAILPDA